MDDSLRKGAIGTLLLLYALEGGLCLVGLGLLRVRSYSWEALSTKTGIGIAVGAAVALLACAALCRVFSARTPDGRRWLALALGANALSVAIALVLGELLMRQLAVPIPTGLRVGETRLLPNWSELVLRSRAALGGVNAAGSWDDKFLDPDPELGWTVAPNRVDRSGRYASSAEGLRSAEPGVRLRERRARLRVALLGDSNAFSLEVPYADSWGHELERLLGPDVQVLNFGVDGYGVDQMLLRYQRDVRPWHPDVVAVGFIAHDLLRTMAVYPFISFEWPGFVVKPRFALESGQLREINAPLPRPLEILGVTRIEDLPYVEYDLGYGTTNWRWRPAWSPLLLRVISSQSDHTREPGPLLSYEATSALNRALFQALRDGIERDGAGALFVEMADLGKRDSLVAHTLEGTRIAPLDIEPCLAQVPAAERRSASGWHFAGAGNRAVAACTAGPVSAALAARGKTD